MSQKLDSLFMVLVLGLLAILSTSAHASPKCLKDQKPFGLSGDTVSWTMSVGRESECIQGLRWSYMQIYSVVLLKAPTEGKIEIVGFGFRYFPYFESHESDSFTLVIVGKNRREPGQSTLQIAVSRS